MDVQYTETTSPESSATDSWWEVSEEGSSITASPHYEHSEPLAQTNDELVNAPATGIEPPPRKKKSKSKSSKTKTSTPPAVVLAVQTPDNQITSQVPIPDYDEMLVSDAPAEPAQAYQEPEQTVMPENEKPKKKRSKKRSRPDYNEADVSRVRLSREELLRVTSQELEEFAARAAAEQPLTPEEMREIKRQRRLIKNREYAQMSRGKKKIYLQELETRFNEIEAENYDMRIQIEELNNRVAMLEAENEQLRQQLAYYESSSVPGTSLHTSGFVSKTEMDLDGKLSDSMSMPFLSDLLTVDTSPPPLSLPAKAVTALQAGVCLLVVALSFAVFINPSTLAEGGVFDQAAQSFSHSASSLASHIHRHLNFFDQSQHEMPIYPSDAYGHHPPKIENPYEKSIEEEYSSSEQGIYAGLETTVVEPEEHAMPSAKKITMDDLLEAEKQHITTTSALENEKSHHAEAHHHIVEPYEQNLNYTTVNETFSSINETEASLPTNVTEELKENAHSLESESQPIATTTEEKREEVPVPQQEPTQNEIPSVPEYPAAVAEQHQETELSNNLEKKEENANNNVVENANNNVVEDANNIVIENLNENVAEAKESVVEKVSDLEVEKVQSSESEVAQPANQVQQPIEVAG